MAGDWIKLRKDLRDDPQALAIATRLGMDVDAVVGKLAAVWGWADTHTTDGNARFVTMSHLDAHARATHFAQAMQEVGWLEVKDGTNGGGVCFPRFDVHNGETAKQRALTKKRMERHRVQRSRNAKRVTREEKRREEINTPLPPLEGAPTPGQFLEAWNACPAFVQARALAGKRLKAFQARARDPAWSRDWRAALDKAKGLPFCCGTNDRSWRATPDWFLRTDTVTKILEGVYDFTGRNSKGAPPKPPETPEQRAARLEADRRRREQDRQGALPLAAVADLFKGRAAPPGE